MDETTYKKLKTRVENARATKDRATGQLDAVLERLKKEHGCDTIEAAEKLASKLEKEATAAEEAFDTAATAFEKEYREHLAD